MLSYIIMKMTHPQNSRYEHRGVAPIIATLLMVAIAVVGGILIFVFAQGFFTDSQITTSPPIESLSIVGHDARDLEAGVALLCANGDDNPLVGVTEDNKIVGADDEAIAVYILNNSPKAVTISELRIGGLVFQGGPDDVDGYDETADPTGVGVWALYDASCTVKDDVLPTLEPGETVTLIAIPDGTYKVGREAPINIITGAGNKFTGSIPVGTQRG